MPFKQDLLLGEKYQTKLLDIIEYDNYEMATGNFKPWDVKIEFCSDTITFEVKADRKATTTNNIAIEYQCNNKPSGISTTEADYWAYFLVGTNTYYLIPTSTIRTAIENKKYTRIVNGGDGFRSSMYLFPLSAFTDFQDAY